MTERIHFTKMHGAGNDYIYVDTLLYKVPQPEKTAQIWSDRHKGIGGDGLVLIGEPKDKQKADFSMRIFNADGSEAMMCGNASRCIGKYLHDKGLTQLNPIRLETLSGVKTLELHLDKDNGEVESVTVDMLEPRLNVPEQYTGISLKDEHPDLWNLMGAEEMKFVSMGNPHCVIFVPDVESLDIEKYGKLFERDVAFPERCNIEFAQLVGPATIRTRVWERGSGITQACGTGACATAVAAALTGRTPREATIKMDGGDLHIKWDEDNHVKMTGPAAFCFEGDAELPE